MDYDELLLQNEQLLEDRQQLLDVLAELKEVGLLAHSFSGRDEHRVACRKANSLLYRIASKGQKV